jgi:hypothetical protein
MAKSLLQVRVRPCRARLAVGQVSWQETAVHASSTLRLRSVHHLTHACAWAEGVHEHEHMSSQCHVPSGKP